ncbi:hypothetical protein MCHIJ_37040 [Mycolicibacterium chitae]|uniref:Uncharacterized protein n=1 Tax=Mycolicibacterium chitae TaxID=1792 RepID=A0A448I5W1_MYCCI|nr:hypothetical protein [Mycolicibacterium chitae]MCV7107509.1 hypothetical protein [Mycolicibacterium chitae]BBZ04267.1 hypothetical protein MCHIJ_37040 [Mycolicibacterium chitae]VEG47908.1 Uncharacterised protein [Mycolicibacterium chitae]
MRKAIHEIPIVAAAALVTAFAAVPVAGASPVSVAPIPVEFPYCDLGIDTCGDDDLQLIHDDPNETEDMQFGGGAAFGN